MWRKIVVVALGLALALSFGLGAAMAPQGSPRAVDAQDLLARYDEQATTYWMSGQSEWPALEQSLGPIRRAVDGEGFRIVDAESQSSQESVREDGQALVVEASTSTTWVLTGQPSGSPAPSGQPPQTRSSSTDRHRLTFDASSGELLRDEFLPDL
ncbi:hypothetical protein [Luteococcus sp. OSA5]|uniref:hypothetical protein n=1 Tax=Luteococcus sp. OSA5 TaxID=3401630 RepID=UPI003B4329F4